MFTAETIARLIFTPLAIELKNILVEIEYADWDFSNPMRLYRGSDMERTVGEATVRIDKDKLYADITFSEDMRDYLKLYPGIAFNPHDKVISALVFTSGANPDERIQNLQSQLCKKKMLQQAMNSLQ